MIDFAAFADELTKLAAPRWKRVLRAGGLLSGDINRLTRAGVLNYKKEVAGLERGNAALSKKLGVPIRSLREHLLSKGKQAIKERSIEPAAQGLGDALSTPQLGGALTSVNPSGISIIQSKTFAPRAFRKAGPEVERAANALFRRHELDEVREALHQRRKIGDVRLKFRVFRKPTSLQERVAARQLDLQRRQIEFLKARKHPALRQAGENMEMGATIGGGISPTKVPKGQIPVGVHLGPSVIARESRNAATLSPKVRKILDKTRVGEDAALRAQGFRYGQEIPKKQLRRTLRSMETA